MGGQGQSGESSEARALESLLAFWSQAGVDAAYGDQPVNRLAPTLKPVRAATPPAVSPPPRPPPAPLRPEAAVEIDMSAAVAEAARAAQACETLEDLETAIAAFDGCPLKFSGATRAVFARGDPAAPVM